MKSRTLAIALIVVGLLATVAGFGVRKLLDENLGHHDGRTPTFALSSTQGSDEMLVTEVGDDPEITVEIDRAGQPITDWGEVHGEPMHVFAVRPDLTWFTHVDPAMEPDGVSAPVDVIAGGELHVVTQSAPGDGPDLLELGGTVTLDGPPAPSDQYIATDDVWTQGDLTIRREGFDFVLSQPWDGDDYHDGPAFITMFHEGDLAFTHGHATMPDDGRFRFTLQLPGRGAYLAALQFWRHDEGGELVTALFRFEL